MIGLMKLIEVKIKSLNVKFKESTAEDFSDKVFASIHVKDFSLNFKYSKKEKFIVGAEAQALEAKIRPNAVSDTKLCKLASTSINAVIKIPASHNIKLSGINSTIKIKTDFIFLLLNDEGIKELVVFINKTMLIKAIRKYFKFDIYTDENTRRFSTNLLEADSMAQVR